MADGLPVDDSHPDGVGGLLEIYHEQKRLLRNYRCPVDRRIEAFLQSHLADLDLTWSIKLPDHTLILGRYGLARELSLPARGDEFASELLTSFRVRNGV